MKIIVSALSLGLFSFFQSYKKKIVAVSPKKMNVIFILADDLSWSDCKLFENKQLYEIPNLERLLKRCLTFSIAHPTSLLYSPTRAGISPGQTGITAPNCDLPQVNLKAKVTAKAPMSYISIKCESSTHLSTDLLTLGKMLKT